MKWNRRSRAMLYAIVWMGLIFYFSHQPGSESAATSSSILEFILSILKTDNLNVEFIHTFIRKSAHFLVYLVLGILLYRVFEDDRYPFLLAWFGATIYAITDEIHQRFIPGRSGEIRDVFIDSSGALIGILLYIYV